MISALREANGGLINFLSTQSSVPILQIDNQQHITVCNNSFLKLFSLSKLPEGANLSDFLLSGDDGVVFEHGCQEFIFNPQTHVRGAVLAHRFPYKSGLLLWCERPLTTDNQVVEKMTILNNELISMQRELTQNNYQLKQVQRELAEKVAQLETALSYAKRLEAILPVCVYCKKIRDDADTEPGKGKWMRMEKFLYLKSGSEVSHGCCPECFELHRYD